MKRFLIVGPARSGTTALRMAVDGHPQALCHGEILAPSRVIGASHHTQLGRKKADELLVMRNRDIADFVDFALTNGDIASGLKVLYHQLMQVPVAATIEALVDDKALPIIFLWRRNLAKRYLSEVKLLAQYRARHAEPADIVVNVEAAAMLQDCKNQLAMRRRVTRMFAGHPSLSLVFEEITQNKEIPEINSLLNLPSPIVRLSDMKDDYTNSTTIIVQNEREILEVYDAAEPEL